MDKNITCWTDFKAFQAKLSNKAAGDAFELLCKYYFKFHPKNENVDSERVWLLSEIPESIKRELNLNEDTGFDLLLQDKQGNYIPAQCKYHSDPKKNLTWEEASTFFGKYYSNDKYQQAYLCTSAYGVSRHYEDAKTKPVIRVMGSDFQNLDKEFFDAVRCELEGKKHNYEPFKPRAHQEKAIKDAKKHFLKDGNSRGKLIFPCGSGKSLTGFWLAQELKAESVVVAVPSLSLVKQTLDVYLREIVANKKSVEWLCICSEADIGASAEVKFEIAEVGVPCTTNLDAIKQWLERTKGSKRIIFTTYQSGRLIGQISKALGQSFDLGIFDEAHKTVGSTSKLFSYLLFEENISIHKRVFMTATERFYSGSKDDIVSMDDAEIYGEVFTHMSFKDAIEQDLLTDYKVITIDVSKAEIAGFIRDNKLVELSKEFGKEAEARSLASMLALRKAMKRFGIKNAVSFHSSIRKAKNASQIQDYITKHYDFKSIDSYTVDGGMPTGKREVIINEFAASPKALITNARCLTEGVDVPNIDCIVFADPRRSKIDIVQALGRALRKKEGKDWGYVILPVVYDGDSHEIDNDNFKEIVSIIRGLAANDERIIEHFKDKQSLNEAAGRGMTSEQFMFLTEALEESEFQDQIGIKIWEGLSKFQWLPFTEARMLVRALKLESRTEWNLVAFKHKSLPVGVPTNPHRTYRYQGWISMNDWLGISKYEFVSFAKAKIYARSLGCERSTDWFRIDHPSEIPNNPAAYYKEKGWRGWRDFIGLPEYYTKRKLLSYQAAKRFLKPLEIKNIEDYQSAKLPDELPRTPDIAYKGKGWVSWYDYLGKATPAPFISFDKAVAIVRQLNIKSNKEWREYVKTNQLDGIPKSPDRFYAGKGWRGWGNWLGTNTKGTYQKTFCSLHDAKEFLKSNGATDIKDYSKFRLEVRNKINLPPDPEKYYESKGWKGWKDFLGTITETES